MEVKYVFAGAVVTNRDRAVTWYERLLGRPPDFLPNKIEAVWLIAETGSLYLVAIPIQAGRGIMTLVVENLDTALEEIVERGIRVGKIEEMPGAGRKSVISDPDGNTISVLEIFSHS